MKQPFEIYDEFLQQYSDSVATNCQPPDVLLVWMEKWAIYYAATIAAERDQEQADHDLYVQTTNDMVAKLDSEVTLLQAVIESFYW